MEAMRGTLGMSALLVGILAGAAGAVPPGQPAALDALAHCRSAERLEGGAQRDSLERGLALATAAVAADDRDAAAHFAVFCTLGRLVQLRGLNLLHPLEALRALGELDTALRLAPDDADVLAAKGATLMLLPRLLGGDPQAGREWLRRALARDPHHCAATAYLVASESRDGATADALRVPADC
jgi:hypothetical protein